MRYNIRDVKNIVTSYQNSVVKPYIHLVDGGLTDNLGLTNLLDIYDTIGSEQLSKIISDYRKLKRIVVISVNAQNSVYSGIDLSADIPGTSAVVNAVINVPIDQNSRVSLMRFRHLVDDWNTAMHRSVGANKVFVHFVSLNLKDLPESQLKFDVLNMGTSFYLSPSDVDKLKQAASVLLKNSSEYQDLIEELQQ